MTSFKVVSEGPQKKLQKQSGVLSNKLWKLDWSRFLPMKLNNHSHALEEGSFLAFLDFFNSYFSEDYAESTPDFFVGENPLAKKEFYEEIGDFFIFRKEREIMGAAVFNPSDWNTYYLRSILIRKEYRGLGYFQYLIEFVLKKLESVGVGRVEAQIAPANALSLHVLIKFGFVVSGLSNSERWGSLVHLTRFLNRGNEKVFLNKFNFGSFPKKSDPI